VLKVDLHTHTADDPHDRIPYCSEQLIDRAAALGFDALAITLHDKQLDVVPLRSYARERGVVLIPGIERTIAGKHVLLLNFGNGVEDVRTFDDLAALKRRHHGLVIAPHPYFPSSTCLWGLLDDYGDVFDAVEVNGMFTSTLDFNQPAIRWAKARGTPIVGNGDVHRLVQLGTTFSLVDAERDPDAICGAIAAGRVEVCATPHSWSTVARVMGGLLLRGLLPRDWHAPVPSADAA
jgi:predicted metal-dependent phosphoesterase TrpH